MRSQRMIVNPMQQRYYDPAIGRFLSVDPVAVRSAGDNFNRYWYANNNPYKLTDPDGRDPTVEWSEYFPRPNNPTADDVKARDAAQRATDLTENAVNAGSDATRKSEVANWRVTIDPSQPNASGGGIANTDRNEDDDGNPQVFTTYGADIANYANPGGTVGLTGVNARSGDPALLAIGAHEIAHGSVQNQSLTSESDREHDAASQSLQIIQHSPDVKAKDIRPCATCYPTP